MTDIRSSEDDPVVLINVYRCDATKQAELMEHLELMLKVQRDLQGFVSATLHRGLNGRTAAVHSIWLSRDHWKVMARHPSIMARLEPIMALATFEPNLYEPGEVID
jgi:hypothetical protein